MSHVCIYLDKGESMSSCVDSDTSHYFIKPEDHPETSDFVYERCFNCGISIRRKKRDTE